MACLITIADNQNNALTAGCTVPAELNTGLLLLCDTGTRHLECNTYLVLNQLTLSKIFTYDEESPAFKTIF